MGCEDAISGERETGVPGYGNCVEQDKIANRKSKTANVAKTLGRVRSFLSRAKACAPALVALALGLILWLVYYPACMGADSFWIYAHAKSGEFTDWHAPVMSILLAGLMRLGGGVGALTFVVCLAGTLGVQRLAGSCTRLLYGRRLSHGACEWTGLACLVLLLIPVSPLLFYLMTFGKDSWMLVAFVWIVELALRLDRKKPGRPGTIRIVALIALAGLVPLIRHNGVLCLPVLCLVVWLLVWRRRPKTAPLIALAPVFLAAILFRAQYNLLGVERSGVANQCMAQQLIGLCILRPDIREEMPYTSANVIDEHLDKYIWGETGPLWYMEPLIVRSGFVTIERPNPKLSAEYWRMVRRHPLSMLHVNWIGFVTMLGIDRTSHWAQRSIVSNPFGVRMNDTFAAVRLWIEAFISFCGRFSLLRWLTGVHLVWIVIDLAWIAAVFAVFVQKRIHPSWLAILLLFLPLSYYGSYMLAMTARYFRYMYPATLLVQILFVSALFGGGVALHAKRRDWAKAP